MQLNRLASTRNDNNNIGLKLLNGESCADVQQQ